MTVFDNVAFGLKVRPRGQRPSRDEIRKRVMDLLSLVQLHTLAHRYPSELSGGQRQRVALARALAVEPRVLLLDEPFGALDAKVRKELRRWLRRLHDEIHITSVFVTHDQEEALEVADRVAVMNEGQIEQEGTPEEVYHHPRTPFILNFLGNVNLFHGRMEEGRAYLGNTRVEVPSVAFQDHQTATVFIRPHLLDIHPTPPVAYPKGEGGDRHFPAKVSHVHAAGPLVRVDLISEWGDPIEVEISHARYRELHLKEHDQVFVTPKEMKVFVEDYSI
jgi:sulfate transport system ATP-binding protein